MQGDLDEVIDALTEDAQAALLAEMGHDGDVTPTLAEAARRLAEAGVPTRSATRGGFTDWALARRRRGRRARFRRRHRPARRPLPVSRITGAGAPSGSTTSASPTPCSTPARIPKRWWRSRWAAPFATVLDLGTGSGCILLSLLAERPGASGLGTDISAAALAVARQNAARLGVEGGPSCAPTGSRVRGRFDLIVSNPPYIAEADMPASRRRSASTPRSR
jgi:SAM-dependent methyltransferase